MRGCPRSGRVMPFASAIGFITTMSVISLGANPISATTTACSRCGTVFATWYSGHTTLPKAEVPAIAEATRKFEELRTLEIARRRKAIVGRNIVLTVAFALLILFTLCHR